MKNSTPILDQVAQKIEQSRNSSTTAAGHRDTHLDPEKKEQLIDGINQSFELLRLNYHHLYFSAYSEVDALNSAKRLWMESLQQYPKEIILQAVHQLIKESDYLPTISRVARTCTALVTNHSLPSPRNAYIEACNAGSPKANVNWSHPAVYYAGKKSDWFFLANNEEKIAYPVFKSHYEVLCQQIINGEELPTITPLALPSANDIALSKEENIERMKKMRADLGV